MLNLAGEIFFTEEEAAVMLGKAVSSLRSDAARRRGPPRISLGGAIYYRATSLRDYLISHEVNYDTLIDSVRDGDAQRRGAEK